MREPRSDGVEGRSRGLRLVANVAWSRCHVDPDRGSSRSRRALDTYHVYTEYVNMKNITLAIDEETLAAGRAYAERHNTTLNALVRDLLARTVHVDRAAAVAEMFRLMDSAAGHSRGERWTRDELHERR